MIGLDLHVSDTTALGVSVIPRPHTLCYVLLLSKIDLGIMVLNRGQRRTRIED